MSKKLRDMMREYRRHLIIGRPGATKAEPVIAAKPRLTPRVPEARPHVPTPDYRLRVSHF